MNGIEFVANEPKSFIVEFDWARENVTKDWSVSAWAASGEIEVSHVDGITSDTLPYISGLSSEEDSASGSTSGSTGEEGSPEPSS